MKKTIMAVLATAYLVSPEAPLMANEVDTKRGQRPITLGVGVIWEDKVYEDYEDSDKFMPVPLVLWEGKKFFFRADTFGYKLIESGPWEIAPIIALEGEGYDDSSSDALDGMGDRDLWVGAGAHIIWQPAKYGLKLQGTGDITDESNGGRVSGEAFYETSVNNWYLRGTAMAEWVSEGFNQYYYGVDRDDVIDGVRPRYRTTDAVDYHIGGSVGYTLDKWLFIGFARYSFFSDEVDDSPITEDDQMLSLGAGVAYTFGGP